jgi:hypothetical protein
MDFYNCSHKQSRTNRAATLDAPHQAVPDFLGTKSESLVPQEQ